MLPSTSLPPALCLLIFAATLSTRADPGPMELFYTSAASYSTQTSNDALPIGNGKLAAMIYGGVGQEIIQFNEDTVWAGRPNDYAHPGAADWLDEIRNHVWLGQGENAWNLAARDHFMSLPLRQSPYQPAGNLRLNFSHGGSNYRRSLDLERAVAKVEYTSGGVTYTREYFASYPDQVMVIRLTASEAGALSFNYAFDSQHTASSTSFAGTDLLFDARVNQDVDSRRQQVSEVEFQARVRVFAEGGSVSTGGSAVTVTNADAVTLVMSVASNFVRFDDLSADPAARTAATLAAAATKDYPTLLADHLADYQALFQRVELDLNSTNRSHLPTSSRLAAVTNTAALEGDLQLVALNFQMARYLMIAGSRPGSQPHTLQGKWNNEVNPAWESKMTLNINQEMNYWLTEVANLGECHVPMIDLVRDLSETGARVASEHYGAGGWMVHHNTDLWRGAAPINNPGGLWPSGGAWLSMHLWWHYQYSRDPAVLAEIYPLMKGAAEFFVDFLVLDPRPGAAPYLLTNPSHSPERPQSALRDDGEIIAGPTIDNQVIRGLFSYVIEASEILDTDADLRARLTTMRAQLPPNQIGKHGQIQEWLEDVDVPENPAVGGHRHLSHLVGLFPGDEIHPLYEPAMAAACKVVLDWKGDPTNNTSWSQAWKMCLRTALHAGDHAFMILANVLRTSHSSNMTFSRKGGGSPENQIDGNFGVAMGTVQFFLQNRRGEIHLLPALPSQIPRGRVAGLRAPGAFTIGIEWAGGELTQATVHSERGETCRLRTAGPIHVLAGASNLPLVELETGLYEFPTTAGQTYTVLPGAYVVVDTDGDGLDDALETALAPLGFDPAVDSTARLALLRSHAPRLGRYTLGQLRALAGDNPVVEFDAVRGGFFLDLRVHESGDLDSWAPLAFPPLAWTLPAAGLDLAIPAGGSPEFYTLEVLETAGPPSEPLPTLDPTDSDGDGIGDADEAAMADLGFDPTVDSSDLLDLIEVHAAALGLFEASALGVIRFGAPRLEVDSATGELVLRLELSESDGGGGWTPLGFVGGDISAADTVLSIALPAAVGSELLELRTTP
jgi:alpha-L-fucosidase 2